MPLRPYPDNSPQAAGRVMALAILADGELCEAERRMLLTLDAAARLGLDAPTWQAVVCGFAEDLAASRAPRWAHACQVDPWTMAGVFDAVTDPALRRRVLRLCAVLVEADDRIDAGESTVLTAAVEHWGLQAELIQPEPA